MYKFHNRLLTSGVCLIFPSLKKIRSYKFKNCTQSPLISCPSYYLQLLTTLLKLGQHLKIWFIDNVVGHNIQCTHSKRNATQAPFNIPSVHSSPLFSLPPNGFLSSPLHFLLDPPWSVPPLPSAPLQTLIHHRVCHQDLPDLLMTPGK